MTIAPPPYHTNHISHIRHISPIGNLNPINSTYTHQPLKRPLNFKANLALHGIMVGKSVRYACIIVYQNNIIQQASQSVLAQANQRPTIALSLLG